MTARAHFAIRTFLSVMLLAFVVVLVGDAYAQSSSVRPPESTKDVQTWGSSSQLPTTVVPQPSDPAMWQNIRKGATGNVSIPDKKAGLLVQSEGENWRNWRNGPIAVYGGWLLLGIVVILVLFFALRGRIRIDAGFSGLTVERFNGLERFAHWLLAGSFIILAVTGLNMLYGRDVLMPIIGADAFGALTQWGKYVHNYLAFAFMVSLVLVFVLWIRHNFPNRHDMVWLAKAGGLLAKGVHPPARKFNAGQKVLYWLVLLGGASISLSGIMLLFPFEFAMFGGTFAFLNVFGFGLPTELGMMQEMQLAHLWHTVMSLILIAVVIGHIYIGTVGMEGAFDAMGSGMVDENWAHEHHSVWADEIGVHGSGRALGGSGEVDPPGPMPTGGGSATAGAKAR